MGREKSCGAVVFKRNHEVKYLLLHYKRGRWGFVKGQVELNESERDTVMRELEEETGITKAEFVDGFRKQINYFYRRSGELIFKEVAYFLVEARRSEVRLSHEHIGFEWLSLQNAVKRLTFKNAKNTLWQAHKFLRQKEKSASKHQPSPRTSAAG